KNLLFVGLIVSGVGVLSAVLFPAPLPTRAAHFNSAKSDVSGIRATAAKIDEAFRTQWARAGLQPAARASDLAIARRLSLGLTGRIPSLQEIRQLEAHPEAHRLQEYLAGILADRRYADYLAERFARAFVGTEDGPFLVYRRRRFVSWLSD